jgi:ribosomal protein L11 methyltransferase
MNRRSLWRFSVTTSTEAEETITEWLAKTFGQSACSYTDAETGTTTVMIFSRSKPVWSRAKRAAFRTELKRLQGYGLDIGAARTSLTTIPRQNWAEAWKLHFQPIAISSALLIKPSWIRHHPAKDQVVVTLDPGLSFGTGHHPTTKFCLEQILGWRKPGTTQSFLDIGTGSGILSIAAAKLGYGPIEAFDFDPEAARIARSNARTNHVAGQIRFSQQDLTRLPRRSAEKYSFVCANLISNLLISERQRILARLHPNGLLVLSGILETEFRATQHEFSSAGLRLIASRIEGEWQSGSFAWKRRSLVI